LKNFIFLIGILFCFPSFSQKETVSLDKLIDGWHLAAKNADFKAYFAPTTDDFIFLGTAPGERWSKKEFQTFSKPYFDKGKAWDFKASNRKWNFSKDGKIAWFDEYLKTWMEDCRGSGVCIKEKGVWKLAYYNLTVLIENEKIKEFIQLRKQ
jgi:ketosteroid isomerase-like protein